jgi:hypothetical protein
LEAIVQKIQEENDNLLKAIVAMEHGAQEQFEHLQGFLYFETKNPAGK